MLFSAGPALGVTDPDQEWSYHVDWPPGYATVEITDELGPRSYKMTANCDPKAGMRLKWAPVDPIPDALYEAWYYIPQEVYHPGWFWNVWQWEKATWNGSHSATPITILNITTVPYGQTSGPLYFLLESKVGLGDQYGYVDHSSQEVPIAEWFKLSAEYVWSETDGLVRFWLNDELMFEAFGPTDLDTGYPNPPPIPFGPREWTVNNYTENCIPQIQSLYVRDALVVNSG